MPAAFPVAAVAAVPAFGLVFLVAQLVGQLRFLQRFRRHGEQLGENPFFAEEVVDTLRSTPLLLTEMALLAAADAIKPVDVIDMMRRYDVAVVSETR